MLWWVVAMAWAGPHDVFADGPEWRPLTTATEQDLTIEVRHRPHGDVNCFEGVTTATADAGLLLQASMDVPNAPKWSSTPLPGSEILSRDGEDLIYFQHVDIPDWTLVHDRFWVLRGEPGRTPEGGLRFRWSRLDAAQTAPEVYRRLTEEVGAMEVPTNYGEWLFTPRDAQITEVRYRVCTDAGGALPTWLQRVATRRTLPGVIVNLVGEARRRAAEAPAEPSSSQEAP